MTPDDLAGLIKYAHALVAAIRAFRVLETEANRFERLLISILRRSYQERLRALIVVLPAEVAEEILRDE